MTLANLRKRPQAGVVAASVMAASMWFYVQYVLVPYQQADAARHDRPRGNLSDLYPRWLGARELLVHHRDPYSPEVTKEIQAGYYGRPLDAGRPGDPRDQQGFVYPLYVVFLLAPTVKLPYPMVMAGFRWLLGLLTAASVPIWLGVIRWRPSRGVLAIMLLLTLGSFPAVQGIKLQQLSLLVSALIAAASGLLVGGHLLLAGGLLAVASIKPQLVVPVAGWFALWTAGDLRRRWPFLAGFSLTLAVLLLAAEYVLPGWMGGFREAVAAYGQYTGGGSSLLDVLVTPAAGKVLAAVVILVVAWLGWQRKSAPADSLDFTFTLATVLAATVVVIPMFAPYNQLLLLPAIFLLTRSGGELWQRNLGTRILLVVAAGLVLWPWLATLGLALGSLWLAPGVLERAWAAPLYSSVPIPLATLALLACLGARPLHCHSSER